MRHSGIDLPPSIKTGDPEVGVPAVSLRRGGEMSAAAAVSPQGGLRSSRMR